MKSNFYSILFLLLGAFSFAQVGINTTTPDPSSMLDISSNNKGLLIPRVALTGTLDATTITTGNVNSLLVFNTATAGVGLNTVTPGYYYWYSNKWNRITDKISTLTQYDWNMVYVDEANNTTVFPVSLYGFGNPNLLGIPGDVGALFLDGDNGYVYNFNVTTNSWTMVSHHQGNGNPNTLGIVGSAGEVYVDQLTGQMYGHNGSIWISQSSTETITTLEQGSGVEAGKYTYTSENNTQTQLNIPQIDRFEPNSNGILGQEGDIYVNSSNGDLYTFNGTTGLWEQQGASETVTTFTPTNYGQYVYTSENNTSTTIRTYLAGWGDPNTLSVPGTAGNLYLNNQNGQVFAYVGSSWVLSNAMPDITTTLIQGSGANAGSYTYTNEVGTQTSFKVYRVGTTDPNSSFPILPGVAGDVYVNSTNGDLYTFNGATWILQVQPTPEPWYNAATNTVATSNTQNIYQSGNVGIGSNQAPTFTLDVSAGSNAGRIRQTSSTAGFTTSDGLLHDFDGVNYELINYENGHFTLHNNASPKLHVNPSGNTGIREKLVVGISFAGAAGAARTSIIENAALSEVTVMGTGSGATSSSVDIVRDVSTGPNASIPGMIIGSLKFSSKSSASQLSASNKITGARINAINKGVAWNTLTPSVALSFDVMNLGVLSEAMRIIENGNVGIKTNNPRTSFEIATTDGAILPSGTTAQRPGTPVFGTIRYNSTIGRFEGYVNDVNGDGTLGDTGWRAF